MIEPWGGCCLDSHSCSHQRVWIACDPLTQVSCPVFERHSGVVGMERLLNRDSLRPRVAGSVSFSVGPIANIGSSVNKQRRD